MKNSRAILRPKVGILAGGLLLATAALMWMAPAFACTRQGYIETHPVRAEPGAAVRIEGSQFSAAEGPIYVYWAGSAPENLLATVNPSADGTFSQVISVPPNAVLGQTYQLHAVQNPDSDLPFRADVTFTVAAPAANDVTPVQVPSAADSQPAPAAAPAANESVAANQPVVQAAPAPSPVDGPVPDVVGVSPFGVGTLRAGTPVPGNPISQGAQSKAFAGAHTLSGALSPWLLLPLGVVGIGLVTGSAAYAVRQVRREKVLVEASV